MLYDSLVLVYEGSGGVWLMGDWLEWVLDMGVEIVFPVLEIGCGGQVRWRQNVA